MELFSTKVRVALGVWLCSLVALIAIAAFSGVWTANHESWNGADAPTVILVANSTTQSEEAGDRERGVLHRKTAPRENEQLLATRFSTSESSGSPRAPVGESVQSFESRRSEVQTVDRRPEVREVRRDSEDRTVEVSRIDSTGRATTFAVDVRDEPGGWCDGDWEAQICEVAYQAIEDSGRDPFDPHPGQLHMCGQGRGCLSNLGAVMWLLNCESNLDPLAYAEGYVQGTWNESRGIAQIGNGWGHIATDEQAFDWRWSTYYIASDPYLVTNRLYPECGIKVHERWKARVPDEYR